MLSLHSTFALNKAADVVCGVKVSAEEAVRVCLRNLSYNITEACAACTCTRA